MIPDEISQRNLAVAFQDNPQMASDLVHEAKQIQASPNRITVLVLLIPAVCVCCRPSQSPGLLHVNTMQSYSLECMP